LATGAIALVAGGTGLVAVRLGLAMIAIQAAIGALNDIADTDRDRDLKPGKPLPHGLVSGAAARLLVAVGVVAGLALSLPSGLAATSVAAIGLGVGAAYDLRLKGTAWSWLPFALGIPLLPVYAWLGAAGRLPVSFAILIPVAVAAGAALAIANAVADVERDRAAGVGSVALALGRVTAWRIHAFLHAVVVVVALASIAGAANGGLAPLAVPGGAVVIAVGAVLVTSRSAARRERGWELEAVGIGVVAIGWIAGFGPVSV
jgi:4-hydroxybenzoate polyprenyltransferase